MMQIVLMCLLLAAGLEAVPVQNATNVLTAALGKLNNQRELVIEMEPECGEYPPVSYCIETGKLHLDGLLVNIEYAGDLAYLYGDAEKVKFELVLKLHVPLLPDITVKIMVDVLVFHMDVDGIVLITEECKVMDFDKAHTSVKSIEIKVEGVPDFLIELINEVISVVLDLLNLDYIVNHYKAPFIAIFNYLLAILCNSY